MMSFEEIVREVSYRCKSGSPNWKNKEDISILSEVLSENGYGSVKHELIRNITEGPNDGDKARTSKEVEKDQAKQDKYYHKGNGIYVNVVDKDKDLDQVSRKYTKDDTGNYRTITDDDVKKIMDKNGESGGSNNNPEAKPKDGGQPDDQDNAEEIEQQQAIKNTFSDPDYQKQIKDEDDAAKGKSTDTKPDVKNPYSTTNKAVKSELTSFEAFLEDYQKDAILLSEKRRVKSMQKLDVLLDSFKELPTDTRNTVNSIFARGQIFEGRENAGLGKNRLGYLDVKTLSENREYLLNSYGDGKSEDIKEFVRNSRKIVVSDEYVKSSFELLPKALQSSLMGKGKVGDAGKNKHFLGYIRNDDEITSDRNDPNIKKDEMGKLMVKRGNPGNKDRGNFVWRAILEQGGQDPYTGLPLDLSSIDLEHTVAFDNKDSGEPSPQDYLDREHDDNIIICATNINQKKSNLSMVDFLERHVDTQVDKSEKQFKKITKSYEEINTVATQSKQKAALILDNGKIKKGYDFGELKTAFELDDEIYNNAKTEFKRVAETKRDQMKVSSLKSQIGKDTLMAMGLSRGLLDKSGRRSIKLSSDNIYRGFVLSMANDPDRQDDYKEAWEEARKIGNSDEYRLQGKGQQGMIKYLIDKKFISHKVLSDKKLGRVFNNALNELYDDYNELYIIVD